MIKEAFRDLTNLLLIMAMLLLPCTLPVNAASSRTQHLIDSAERILEDQPEPAVILLREALLQINTEKDPQSASRAYYLLGESFFYLDELDSTISNYRVAAEINVEAGLDKTPFHINILGNLGYMHDVLDQKLIAMDYYEKALKIARETGQKDEIAANMANIAQLRTIQGYYKEALEYMQEVLAIDRETGDKEVMATDLNIIGRIYESWGMYDKAAGYLLEALSLDSSLGLREKMAIRYNSLGLVYKGWGKNKQALEYFNQALQIDQQLGNEEKVALRLANIGSTYLEMNETDKAIPNLEHSLAYFRENDLPSYLATTLNDLGRCYLAKNDYLKAEQYFIESADISRQYNFIRFLLNSLDQLSGIYSNSGRHREAFTILKESTLLNDSIFNAESQKKLAEFNALYKLDQKQQENELLRKNNELSKKRHIVSMLFFSLLGMVMTIVLLVVLIRLKSNQNRRLITEKENEGLKSDLEQKNKELTYNALCIIKNNETVAKIAETLEDALQSGQNGTGINNMVRKLQHLEREKSWTEFEVRFTQVHEDFYRKLNERFPDLTPNEKKLCAFLKLNMSTKDIAAITHQSVHSINVARTRLRKKLGIDQTDENLVNFLGTL